MPGLWVGNGRAAESATCLSELGVTHLLNCAGGERSGGGGLTGPGTVQPAPATLASLGITYRPLPLRDQAPNFKVLWRVALIFRVPRCRVVSSSLRLLDKIFS